MNKTHHELCDENIQLREQLDAAQASTNLARLATRQAIAKAEELERERDSLVAQLQVVQDAESNGLSWAATHFMTMDRRSAQRKVSQRIERLRRRAEGGVA